MEDKHRLLGGVCTTAISLFIVSYAEFSSALWQHSPLALIVEVAP